MVTRERQNRVLRSAQSAADEPARDRGPVKGRGLRRRERRTPGGRVRTGSLVPRKRKGPQERQEP